MGDFNGDGKPDIVTYLGGTNWQISGAQDQAPTGVAIDKLKKVTNGLGAVDSVEYATVNDTTVYSPVTLALDGSVAARAGKRVYPGRQLVNMLHRGNGVSGTLDTRYTYAGYAVDPTGRGNLGFARVDATSVQSGIVSTTWHSQAYPSIGMAIAAVSTTSDGIVLSNSTTSFTTVAVAHAGGATTQYVYPSSGATTRRDLDGTGLGTTTMANVAPDAWGNIGSALSVTTSANDTSKTFSTRIQKTFANDEASWRLGETLRMTETRIVAGSTLNHNTLYSYTSAGLIATETREDADPTLLLLLTTTYDHGTNPFGLVEKVKLDWFDPATQSPQTRTVVATAYATNGRFPVSVTNALGQTELRQFDSRYGTPTQVTTADGLPMTWTTNLTGPRSEIAIDGTETVTNVKNCDASCPSGAVMVTIRQFKRGDVQVAAPTLVFSDSAGHALRSVTYGFDGEAIAIDQRYDSRGRIHETGQPRFVTTPDSPNDTSSPLDGAALAVRTEYDNLNRVVGTISNDESGTQQTSSTYFSGYTIVSTNPLGRTKTDTRDAWGRLEQTIDANNQRTLFEHDAYNNLTQTTDPMNNVITVVYDALGRRTDLVDPDLGHITYSVDPLGQVYKQVSPIQALPATPTRPQSAPTTMRYDALGRMISRTDDSLVSGWTYDNLPGFVDCQATKSCGKLVESFTTTNGTKDFSQVHTYDALGRPLAVKTLLDQLYVTTFGYDAWQRPISEQHQRGAGPVKEYVRRYNGNGELARIEHGGRVLWTATSMDASNRLTGATLGNGLLVTRSYDAYTGRLSSGMVKTAQNERRLQEGYFYDALGNVSQRNQSWSAAVGTQAGGFSEGFLYDEINRLKQAQVDGAVVETFTYNAIGNILTKTGTGTGTGLYDYAPSGAGSVGPHAVRFIPGIGYFGYDANGNLLIGAGRTLTWTAFDMPSTITKGAESSTFTYGPDHQRTIQAKADGTMIYYAGAMEIEVKGGAVVQGKTYWPMGLGVDIDKGTATTLNWTHVDRIGSVVAISDETGALRETMTYDSWGKRRSLDSLSKPDILDGVVDNKGFTGHEMLDQLDLVHMNGRVYDPLIARFVSPDPFIQDPHHSQSFNRYTYVWNNPTNLTDPTGFLADIRPDNSVIPCSQDSRCDPPKQAEPAAPSQGGTETVQAAGTKDDKNITPKSASNGTGGSDTNSATNYTTKTPTDSLSSGYDAKGNYSGKRDADALDSDFEIGSKRFVMKGGSAGQQNEAEAYTRELMATPLGKNEILPALEARRFLWFFKVDEIIDMRTNRPSDRNNAYVNPMDWNTIHIDPYFRPRIESTAGPIFSDFRRVLWHEFGHSAYMIRDSDYMGQEKMRNVIKTENVLMRYIGAPERTKYD